MAKGIKKISDYDKYIVKKEQKEIGSSQSRGGRGGSFASSGSAKDSVTAAAGGAARGAGSISGAASGAAGAGVKKDQEALNRRNTSYRQKTDGYIRYLEDQVRQSEIERAEADRIASSGSIASGAAAGATGSQYSTDRRNAYYRQKTDGYLKDLESRIGQTKKEGLGVGGSVTKDPDGVIGALTDNTTVDASPKGGVAAVAKGTDSQNAMEQLNNYYRQQAAKEKSDLAYADYLTGGKVSQDIKYGNYLTNGRYSGYNSYADYLASIGQTPQDSQKTRDASVARANADYARALAGYGQTGEQLARSGLSNTGYSDASNNAAYAAKQNAILQADATKAATDQSNRLGYAQYLQAYDAQQQSKMLTVLEYTTQAGMTEEQAKAYAKAVGFDDTIAESIGKAQAAYTESTSGTATKATDLYNTLVSNENFAYDPATKNSLRQQLLNSGYDEATVDDVLGRFDKTYTVGQKDSYDLIMKALTDDSVYDQIGSMIDGFYEMNDNDKAVAIDKYVASSNLSYEQKADFFYQKLYQKIMKGETASDVLNELASYQSIGMPKSVYDKVTSNMMGYIALNEDGVPNNFNGKKLSVRAMTTGMVGKEISYLGNAQRGTLKAGNDGKIYKSCGDGRWTVVTKFIIDTIGYSDEKASALYDITYQRLLHRQKGVLSSRKVRSGK